MWGLSYTTALFWNYLMERLGNDRAEPGVGTDFIREFWQNAQDAGSNRDFLGTLRATITEFDPNATLEGLFHDFTVANYTKLMDVSVAPRRHQVPLRRRAAAGRGGVRRRARRPASAPSRRPSGRPPCR